MKHYVCDFETFTAPVTNTSDTIAMANLETAVYKAVILDYDTKQHWLFNDIQAFMEWVLNHEPACYNFHNLGGFDGAFIIDWLTHNGYQQKRRVAYMGNGEYLLDDEITDRFWCGTIDGFTVYHGAKAFNFLDTRNILTGSIKTFGLALVEDGKTNLLKGETPLVEWGSKLEDYTTSDGKPWTQSMLDEYILNDVLILRETMAAHNYVECVNNGITTAASLAANTMLADGVPDLKPVTEFMTTSTPTWLLSPEQIDWFENAIREHDKLMEWCHENGLVVRNKRDRRSLVKEYPELIGLFPDKPKPKRPWPALKHFSTPWDDRQLSRDERKRLRVLKEASNPLVRDSYKGGFNWVNPDTAYDEDGQVKKILSPILILDINSMYPWIYYTKRLPRIPVDFIRNMNMTELKERCEKGELLVARVHVKATCPSDKVPFIKPRTDDPRYRQRTDFESFASYTRDLDHDLTLTSPELKLMFETYNVENVSVKETVIYEEDEWLSRLLKRHCERWMQVKQHSKGTERIFAKLQLNSAYGKLGQMPKTYTDYDYVMNSGRVIQIPHVEYDEDGNKIEQEPSGRRNSDVVTASFITAYGRCYLAESINRIGLDKFLYCDTDSMHVIFDREQLKDGTYAGLNIDSSELGAWALEGIALRGMYIKPKTYGEAVVQGIEHPFMYLEAGEWTGETVWKSTCAGFSNQIAEEDFKPGGVVIDKRHQMVKGGIVIVDYTMQIGQPSVTHQPSVDEIIERAIAKTLGSNKHVDRELLRQHMQENKAAMERKRRGEVHIINSLKDDVAQV